jgi:glycosyltransferase involved in cell wall biosynthesis
MKILWICNTVFPEVAEYLDINKPVFGGWMYSLAEELKKKEDIDLGIVTVCKINNFTSVKLNKIRYFLIPNNNFSSRETSWNKLLEEFMPDIVHVHGTEYDFGMSLMNIRPDLKYVVSIQGLVSVYSRYFYYGMNFLDIIKCITFRDLIRRNTIFQMKASFVKRGEIEKKYILMADAIIGRTLWDKACVQSIKPSVNYYFCNEILRNEFFTNKTWSLNQCNRYTIFLSQASFPYKGLHQVVRALGLIVQKYPEAKIEIAGPDIINDSSLFLRLKRSGYGKYIRKLCRDLGLQNKLHFMGLLNAQQMREAYLRANVFVSASAVENGGNSVGEAQILGVPIIASYAGGVITTLSTSKSSLFYEFESYEMLASHLDTIFSMEVFSDQEYEIKEATYRHSKVHNANQQINIYKNIIEVNKYI